MQWWGWAGPLGWLVAPKPRAKADPAAFSGGIFSCTFIANAIAFLLGACRSFRPLNADGAAAAQRPYPSSQTITKSSMTYPPPMSATVSPVI